MKKIVRLTESDLLRLIKRVINEEDAQSDKQTNKVLPGAENVADFQGSVDYFNNSYGLDLKKMISYYRNGVNESIQMGKEKPYYLIVSNDSMGTKFTINELFSSGNLAVIGYANFTPKGWSYQDQINTQKATQQSSMSEVGPDYQVTLFWRHLMMSTSIVKNSYNLTVFLNECKKTNQPENLKRMISQKTNLRVSGDDGFTEQDIKNIKSSIPYQHLKA